MIKLFWNTHNQPKPSSQDIKTRKKEEGISPIIQRNAGWLTDKIKQDMRIRESNMNDFDRKSQQVMLTRY